MIVKFLLRGDAIERLEKKLDPVKLNKDLGVRASEEFKDHFRERQADGPRNKFGARSSGFWADIGESIGDVAATADSAQFSIADVRFNQKVFGGTIRRDDKALTIPARMEAYGRSPRTFGNLTAIFFKGKKAKGALIAHDLVKIGPRRAGRKASSRRDDQGRLPVFYWLLDSVTQDKDPHALPKPERIDAALEDTAQKHINRLTR